MDINLLERCIQLTFPDLNFKMKKSLVFSKLFLLCFT